MVDRPSISQVLCAVLLILVMSTAGCPVVWGSGGTAEYRAYGWVVSEPPDNASILAYDDARIQDEEVIQLMVADAIVSYENQTGTENPYLFAHASRLISKSQYQKTKSKIKDVGSPPASDIDGGQYADAVVYIRRAGYIVRVWVKKSINT